MAGKRRRRSVMLTRKVRPKDKQIIGVSLNPAFTVVPAPVQQMNRIIYTWTFPGTITGLRWNFSFYDTTGTQAILWVITVQRQGVPSQIIAGTGTVYTPEQNVLAWGMGSCNNHTDGTASRYVSEGTSKAMRKMMGGDQLYLSYATSGAPGGSGLKLVGAIQFFNLS